MLSILTISFSLPFFELHISFYFVEVVEICCPESVCLCVEIGQQRPLYSSFRPLLHSITGAHRIIIANNSTVIRKITQYKYRVSIGMVAAKLSSPLLYFLASNYIKSTLLYLISTIGYFNPSESTIAYSSACFKLLYFLYSP